MTNTSGDSAQIANHEIAAYLLERLGPTLTAYLAGSRSRAMPRRWAIPAGVDGHAEPPAEKAKRLKAAYLIYRMVDDADSDHVARNWLLAANPRSDGTTIAEAIREDRIADAYRATQSFIDDTYYA